MKEIINLSKSRLFLGIVIIAVAMFIFMPINVFATTDYEIYVNGEQFTSEKTTINCGDGTATFDISTNTLILNNATITKRYGWQYAVINSEISNLTIQLIGNNVIDGNEGEYDGIGAAGGSNVVIVGDGNLTIKDVYYGTYIGDYSVPGGNLKINNTTINIENAQATGIWVNHDLEIINSNIKIDKTGDDVYFGIVSNIGGTITIDGGNLDINTNSHCILLGNGDNSNHNVVIKSGNIKLNSRQNGAYGIKFEPVLNTDTINGNIKIDGGNLEISTIAGGTNIDDSKITINSKLIFLKGTSLKDNGKILLNEAKNYYTVTFDSNGGSAVTAQSIEAGQKATKPADPTKDGYDFKGWTLNGSAYDFNSAVNGNITLVAAWEQKQVVPTTYTVSFAANGGKGTMADVTGISGEYTLPANGFTAPDGMQFKAWMVGGSEKAVGDKITVTADTTVTAVWETVPVGHTCDIKPVEKVEPSCTEGGKEAYYKCDGCGKFYEDVLGTKEITDLAAWGNLAKLVHTESDWKSDANGHRKECTECAEKMNVAEHTFTWVTDKEATATEKGFKHEECTVCGYEKAAVEIPATGTTPDYKIIEGANGAWTQNSDGTLTFRANGDFGKFSGVKVDGTLIDASNYTVVSGSTVITLKTDYLKTLSVGTHTLTVVYPDGECSTNFEIKTSQSQNTGTTPTESNTPTTPSDADKTNPNTGAASPQTGDNSTMGLWFALLFVSGAGVVGTTVYRRKKKYSAK